MDEHRLNLVTAVQGNKVMQDFELESLSMGVDHSQKVKATPLESDYGSKDCINLLPSIAVSGLNVGASQSISSDIQHFPLKRIFDICFSLSALIILIPLLALIAIAIRYSSPGKIVYSHQRIGRGALPFRCYKFRTMYSDADLRLKEILDSDPHRRAEWEKTHKLKNDPRVTPIGSFLRRTSLDELPQFWNVLKGDLSVVGPRPVVKEEILRHFGKKADKILSIRPGLTGIWQVSGRSDTCYKTRIAFDEHYVDHRSFWLDLKLIALTLPSMLSKKGAY